MVTILNDCALAALRRLPSDSVDCIITSPPYWGLRDYKVPSLAAEFIKACEAADADRHFLGLI